VCARAQPAATAAIVVLPKSGAAMRAQAAAPPFSSGFRATDTRRPCLSVVGTGRRPGYRTRLAAQDRIDHSVRHHVIDDTTGVRHTVPANLEYPSGDDGDRPVRTSAKNTLSPSPPAIFPISRCSIPVGRPSSSGRWPRSARRRRPMRIAASTSLRCGPKIWAWTSSHRSPACLLVVSQLYPWRNVTLPLPEIR
jgi:hypothetical protein